MATQRRLLGNEGEEAVARHLKENGFTIIARNYSRPYGEIDLIARKKDLIAFIEVKTRRSASFFDMSELIGHSKQRKIITVAKQYLAQHTKNDTECRFDIALVTHSPVGADVCYIPNAFTECE